jgi:ornithine--oxo-acid transaminase
MEGKKYVDMMSAYSAVSLGHAHPKLLKALNEQAQKLALVSRAFYSQPLAPFLKKLCAVAKMDKALPMNSGAEAVETAIKAARRWGYEKKGIPDGHAEIIVAKNNFHGRTTTIISFSSEPSYKAHFGPLTAGFVEIPFGDSEALARAITPNTCAFLVEPIQGEAGIVVPPVGWLKACEQICKKNNVLLIVDEVQSGLGRTGAWFAFEHDQVKPDGVIVGKGLGGGLLPVSAFLATDEVMSVFVPGSHGSTFGGNPLAAHVGLAALTILDEDKLIERSAQLGKILMEKLKAISSPLIKEVRGKGLWVGVEITKGKATARMICEKLMAHGVLSKETHETVIRFAPPLIIDEKTLIWSVDQFAKTLAEVE